MGKIMINEILETLIDIETELSNCKECLQNINNAVSGISKSSDTLSKYNNQPKSVGITRNNNEKIKTTINWNVCVPDDLINANTNFISLMEETESAIDDLNNQINNDEDIAHYIESQINELEKNMDSSQLALAFGALSSSIAIDSYGVANNKFVTISDENMQYWIDNSLQFQWDSKAGAYLILQKDSNGNLVAMGWTDRNSVLNYVKKLEEINNNNATNNDNNNATNNNNDNNNADPNNDTNDNSSDQNQQPVSQTSSVEDVDLGKFHADIENAINNKEDITIPEGVHMTINEIDFTNGAKLQYDSETDTYYNGDREFVFTVDQVSGAKLEIK